MAKKVSNPIPLSMIEFPEGGEEGQPLVKLSSAPYHMGFRGNIGGVGRVVSSSLRITNPTSGFFDAKWIGFEGVTRELVNSPVIFIGLPSTGNFRYDIIQGFNDGTTSVKSGTPATEGSVIEPTPDTGALMLIGVLWNSLGEYQIIPPNPVPNQVDFPPTRYSTGIAPNTTGKYAKIWQGVLSSANNYALACYFGNPVSGTAPYNGSVGQLFVTFTCDVSANIISETVKIETIGDSPLVGEFTLVQLSGNQACILHKASHYWSRIQFGFPWFNTEIKVQDFINGGAYGARPSGSFWDSIKLAGGGSSEYSVPAEHVTVSVATTRALDLEDQINDSVINFTLQNNLVVDITDLPTTTNKAFNLVLTFFQDNVGGRTVTWDYPEGSILWPCGAEIIVGDLANQMTVVNLFWNGAKLIATKSCGHSVVPVIV